jgi:putative membrane protein
VSEMSSMHRTRLAVLGILILLAVPAWSLTATRRAATSDWTWPPFVVLPLMLTAVIYAVGIAKMPGKSATANVFSWRTLCFALGWISLIVALDSPLHELGEQLFWVHMTQHEILILVSAPLLVLGRPLVPFLWTLSPRWRVHVANVARSRAFNNVWTMISAPLWAWLLSALALWIWHVPWLFDKTLQSDSVHGAQHMSFLFTGLLFWWPLVNRMPAFDYGAGLAYVFTTILHTSVLGALLTFSPHPWYSAYVTTAPAWGISALEDQQVGGLIMWIPAGTLLLIVALFLLVKWINDSQDRWKYTRMAELSRSAQGAVK